MTENDSKSLIAIAVICENTAAMLQLIDDRPYSEVLMKQADALLECMMALRRISGAPREIQN